MSRSMSRQYNQRLLSRHNIDLYSARRDRKLRAQMPAQEGWEKRIQDVTSRLSRPTISSSMKQVSMDPLAYNEDLRAFWNKMAYTSKQYQKRFDSSLPIISTAQMTSNNQTPMAVRHSTVTNRAGLPINWGSPTVSYQPQWQQEQNSLRAFNTQPLSVNRCS